MAHFTNVIIGIQARSTSTRFPRKVFETIDGKPMIYHVVDSCLKSAQYLNKFKQKTGVMVTACAVVPYGDELIHFLKSRNISVIEGPEKNVLERYKIMSDKMRADYVVRVTSDCPLLPSFLITKHIKTATINQFDYLSNVDESVRTAVDGFDVEVISKNLLDYAYENAKEDHDKEHVTTYLRKHSPSWAKIGHVIHFLDLSYMKLSVDTPEDLERVRAIHESVQRAISNAEKMHGKESIHRF